VINEEDYVPKLQKSVSTEINWPKWKNTLKAELDSLER
jgi:hypothetical protein